MSVEFLPKSYDEYKDIVDGIRSGNTDAQLLGAGAESTVWKAEVGGNDYAIKIMNPLSARGRLRNIPAAIESKVETGLRARGVSGLEQIQAASTEEGTIIYDLAQGETVGRLSTDTIRSITREQITRLWDTVSVASGLGIEFDGWNDSGDNIFYDRELGFTIIDYWGRNQSLDFESNRSNVIKSLGPVGLRLTELYG